MSFSTFIRHGLRTGVVLLIALGGTGCHVWHVESAASAPITLPRRASVADVTRRDGSRVLLLEPVLRGDTLRGRESGTAAEVRIPLQDVRALASRHLSLWRTAALLSPLAAYVTLRILIYVECRGPGDC